MRPPSARRRRTQSQACCARVSQEKIAIPDSSAAANFRGERQDAEWSNPVKREAQPENTSWEPATSACFRQVRPIAACEVRRERPTGVENPEFLPAALNTGRARSTRTHDEKENPQRMSSCRFQVRL